MSISRLLDRCDSTALLRLAVEAVSVLRLRRSLFSGDMVYGYFFVLNKYKKLKAKVTYGRLTDKQNIPNGYSIVGITEKCNLWNTEI